MTNARLLLGSLLFASAFIFSPGEGRAADSALVRRFYSIALTQGKSYDYLRVLCKDIGPRMTGTPQMQKAIEYTAGIMKGLGWDITLQKVMVPVWERGRPEEVYFRQGKKKIPLKATSLGNTEGTGGKWLNAPIIMVEDPAALHKIDNGKVKGKIVFFTKSMNADVISTFHSYGSCAGIRFRGAGIAARKGAVGMVMRSVNPSADDHPHTGTQSYGADSGLIPALALSTNDADKLEKLMLNGGGELFVKSYARILPEALSYNVIGEIKGSEFPNEIITMGGHLDSWDLGEGAHDDGAGCVSSIEALRILQLAGYRPKRTIRVVMFVNEEMGARGGEAYYQMAAADKENKYIAAFESDRGGYTPKGLSLDTSASYIQEFKSAFSSYFSPYGVHEILNEGSGVDVYQLKRLGALCMELIPDSHRYFDIHHAETDVLEAVNPRELAMGSATMATVLYLLSEYGTKLKNFR